MSLLRHLSGEKPVAVDCMAFARGLVDFLTTKVEDIMKRGNRRLEVTCRSGSILECRVLRLHPRRGSQSTAASRESL